MAGKTERHQRIVEILRMTDESSVSALREALGVTDMTVRRDLEALEGAGVVKRFHGGARLSLGSSYEPPLSVREKTNAAQKAAVARSVVENIEDGESVVLDGGSTGLAIAEALLDRHVTVCPLSLRVAWVLAQSSTIELILPPGAVRLGEGSLSGPETTEYLLAHRYDVYLMTASGLSVERGFSEWNLEDAAVKRAALRTARRTVVAIDSSKLGHEAFVVVCPIDRPQSVHIDDGLSKADAAALTHTAQDLVVVPQVGQ